MQWYIDVFFHRQSFWSILHEDQNNQVGEEDGLTTVAGYEHKKEDGKLIAVVSLGQIMMPSALETFLSSAYKQADLLVLLIWTSELRFFPIHVSGIGVQFWLANTTMPPSVTKMWEGELKTRHCNAVV